MLLEEDVLPNTDAVELSDLGEGGRLLGGGEDGENRGGSLAVGVGEVAVDVGEECDVREENGEVAEALVLLLQRLLGCAIGCERSALGSALVEAVKTHKARGKEPASIPRGSLPRTMWSCRGMCESP
jgi:hypothetical protein